jgi:cell division protein FtsL
MRNLFTISFLVISVLAIVTFTYHSRLIAQNASTPTAQQTAFVSSFQKLVGEANNLTQSYQGELMKWKAHQLDNKTMVSVTDSYLPKYEKLINQSKTLPAPKEFQNATNLYTQSLASELQSYKHFKNYLSTNNSTENQLASKSLSDSFVNEVEAFKALKPSGLFNIMP